MVAIAARPGSTRSAATLDRAPLRLVRGASTDRDLPSAAVPRRWVVMVLVAVAVCGSLLGAGSLAGVGQPAPPVHANVPAGPLVDGVTVHVVQPGETLWSVARQLQPGGDVRPLVARLRVAAGGPALVPGQRLRLAV